jgi:apolipoprotein N-acyltransferase
VSFVVEPHGRMYAETPLFTEVKRVLPVRVARVPTVYSVLGDWFVVASAGLLAGLWFSTRQRRGR